MRGAFRQSMAWLHTWSGLLLGWLLFFIFLTGTAGYFDTEIDRWMQPERPLAGKPVPMAEAVAVAVRRLEQRAPRAAEWTILPPNGRENTQLRILWRDQPASGGARARRGSEYVDVETGQPVAWRQTGGGQLLYRMHHQLHYLPTTTARWIVGVATMFMLVAIVTGVITHRRIFRNFFVFRPDARTAWLDAHNVLAVLALPFHVMITYTGLVFIMYLYMAPIVAASYGASEEARRPFNDAMFSETNDPGRPRAGVAASLPDLRPLIAEAESHGGEGHVRSVTVFHPGDRDVRVVIKAGEQRVSRGQGALEFTPDRGVRLAFEDGRSIPKIVLDTLLSVHEGLFAGPALRWLFFLSGLMGTAMIGIGLILWTHKRRGRLTHDGCRTLGLRLVDSLNVATIVGLPVAIAAYFWANRLIPASLADRAAWEANALFIAWAVLLLHAFVRPRHRAWIEQLWLAAAVYALLPLLNALTTDRHLGITLRHGDWDLAGFDLFMLACGALCAVVARMMRPGASWTPLPRPA